MESNNGSKPAYPASLADHVSRETIGLTKREIFTKAAMQAIIPSYMSQSVSLDDIDAPCRAAAQWAIKFADETLKQLES